MVRVWLAQAAVDRASFFLSPRPFKSLAWQRKKDARGSSKPKNAKQILQAERDRMPRQILPSGEQGEALGCKFTRARTQGRGGDEEGGELAR